MAGLLDQPKVHLPGNHVPAAGIRTPKLRDCSRCFLLQILMMLLYATTRGFGLFPTIFTPQDIGYQLFFTL
jgi:hypothetical protein